MNTDDGRHQRIQVGVQQYYSYQRRLWSIRQRRTTRLTMSMQCELSGEILATSSDEVVVTPSGHICLKRLLLSRLSENRGVDPFHEDRPLSEDELITLNSATSTKVVLPRTNQTSSMPGLLTALQNEYDVMVLVLFDTRKALEETRRELSQALYQNDAAMRVVARVAMERDQARQQLEEWKAGSGDFNDQNLSNGRAPSTSNAEDMKSKEGSASKKRKLDDSSQISANHMVNDIPEEDLNSMVSVWERLHKNRKAFQKDAATVAPSHDDVAAFALTKTEDWHHASCDGVTAIALNGDNIVTTGKDKSVVVFNVLSERAVASASADSEPGTCVDLNDAHIVAGFPNCRIKVWTFGGEAVDTVEMNTTGDVVAVQIHPDKKHILAAAGKTLSLMRLEAGNNKVNIVAVFERDDDDQYTSGALHPDGLIYVAGCSTGKILLWDLKSRSMAGTLKDPDIDNNPVVSLHVSNNGYHIAAAYSSGRVCVWDLRKQKVIATLNQNDNALESVLSVAFDPSGKYLAYSGAGGMRVLTVKEWDKITSSLGETVMSGIAWGKTWVAGCNSQQRQVTFYGKPSS